MGNSPGSKRSDSYITAYCRDCHRAKSALSVLIAAGDGSAALLHNLEQVLLLLFPPSHPLLALSALMLLCSILGVKTFGAGRAGVRLRSKPQNKRNELDRKQEESFAQGRVEQRSWRPSIHTGYPDTRLCIWHNILLNCTTSFKVQNSDLFSWFLFTHSFPCFYLPSGNGLGFMRGRG